MKKIAILALFVMLTASITACGEKTETATTVPTQEATTTEQAPIAQAPADSAQQQQTQPEAPTPASAEQTVAVADPNTAQFDDFRVVYKSAKIIKNNDESILEITFDYTNLQDDSQAFILTASVKAFQNGVELSDAYFVGGNLEPGQKELKKDITLEVYDYYKIQDMITPIEVEISPLITFDSDEKVVITIDPATLQS